MAVVVLARHGRTTANAEGVLAGWTPGVGLDATGRGQAERLGRRLAGVPLAAVVASPLQRCVQTAEAVLAGHRDVATGSPRTDARWGECRYGAWTGRRLADLAREPLWRVVQDRPSAAEFPAGGGYDGESLTSMQQRAVTALEDWDARVEAAHGPGAVWAVVSHGDVLKAVLAWALGTDLDRFQRLVVDPGSLSILRLTRRRPLVLRVNDTGSDPVDLTGVSDQAAKEHRLGEGQEDSTRSGDVAPGGGAGS